MPTNMALLVIVWYVPFQVIIALALVRYRRVTDLCKAHYPAVQYQNLRLSVWLWQYNEARTRALMRLDRQAAPELDHAITRFYRYRQGMQLFVVLSLVVFVLLYLRYLVAP